MASVGVLTIAGPCMLPSAAIADTRLYDCELRCGYILAVGRILVRLNTDVQHALSRPLLCPRFSEGSSFGSLL